MRNLLFIMAFALTVICNAQDTPKWRTLTFTGIANAGTHNNSFLPQFSASLDYELIENFGISSWNGFAYNTINNQSWFASQTTIDKRISNTTVGIGYLYTTNSSGIFAPIGVTGNENNFYLSMKLQYRIKL